MNKENKQIATKDNRKLRKIVVLILFIVTLIGLVINFRGNYLEIKEIGESYLPVFWKDTIAYAIAFVLNFLFIFLAFYLTNKEIKRNLKIFFDEEDKEIPKFPNKSISFVIALVGSIATTRIILNQILLFLSNSKFGITDKIFNLDLSFMILQKPFIQLILIYLLVILIATIAYALIYSIIILNKSLDGISRETITKINLAEKLKSRVRLIAILLGLFVITFMALNIGNEKFMNIELNDGTQYSLYGASISDATVKLVGYVVLAVLVIISVLKAYKAIIDKNVRKFIGTVMIVPVYFIALAIILALYSLIFIGSNQLSSNEDYIKNNINSTKEAYGINISENTIDYSGTITYDQISQNTLLLNNIDIVGNQNVLQDLENSRDSKGYYSYRSTQIQEYNIDGVETLCYITPREISNSNTTYTNKTYEYTHGYGIIATLAGSTNENGNLETIQNQFGDLTSSKISISQPRIYFGLENNSAIIINSNIDEVDYIQDDTTKTNAVKYKYDGIAGLKLNFIDRLILAIREGNFKLAFASDANKDSKIITNRKVINRAKVIMPYLDYDENAYMIIDDLGNQYWVIDAYTMSNNYPFSQKATINGIKEINYIRNSVKVIINAYTGETKFYITDRKDPIVMAYNNIFPDLFAKENETIPEGISKHFVYPKKLYNIQSEIIQKYHNIEPEVLYRGNDIWGISKTLTSGSEREIMPYYTMVKQDGHNALGLILPYSDYNKQNLRAYLVGTYINGVPKLTLTRYSSDTTVLGPIQLETQINQDEIIAQEIASLNTTGTKITKNLMMVPINNTILYVETIYQQLINETTQKPMLKKVVLASGNKVAIGENVMSALSNLLSKNAADLNISNNENIDDLINAIIKANENLNNSSKAGDWKLYGEDMQTLINLINQLKTAQEAKQKEEAEKAQSLNNTVNEVLENTIQ